jgi:predicted RNase H-like HicB family nuclease
MSVSTYTAVANPAQTHGWFLVHVPEIDQCTQARSEPEIEPMARDLAAR